MHDETQSQFFRHMENGLINEFSKKADRRFRELHGVGKRNPYLIGSALCGQDRDLADYLLGADGRFALIEFKANAERLKTEGKKPRRLRLLEACLADSARLARSRAIHYTAWAESAQLELPGMRPQTQLDLVLAPYADKIGTVLGMDVPKRREQRWTDDAFLRSYLENRIAGSNMHRFKRYLTELYELAGTQGGAGLEGFQGLITVYVPLREPQFQSITFNSFQHLMELTIHFTRQRVRDLEQERQQERSRSRERGGPQR